MLGLVCHTGDSSVAGNQLRSSRRLDFLAVLALLVPCTSFLQFMLMFIEHDKLKSQGGPSTLAHFSLSCVGAPHGQRWPKAKNDSSAMSSDSSSSGDTGPQAVL